MLSYAQSGLRFARRNSAKIVLFTIAAGAAVTAATYMRRQLAVVNESLASERAEGARKLRVIFVGNMHAVRATFRALLPVMASSLGNVRALDSSECLVRLRERPGLAEREQLFGTLRVAAVTRLASTVYIVSVFYCVLSLQMNLIARYFNANLDAPVQALPSGLLSDLTSKRFLDVARSKLLRPHCIDSIVRQIEQVVRVHVEGIGLTERVGLAEVECLFVNILCDIGTKGMNFEIAGSSASDSDTDVPTTPKPLQQWLFENGLYECDADGGEREDANYKWLLTESLDLCEILDFNSVVQSTTKDVLSYAMSELKEVLFSRESECTSRPFAHFFARFEGVASDMFKVSDNNDGDDRVSTSVPKLERVLSEAQDCARFSASVFLSGEKESEQQQTDMADVETQMNQQSNLDHYVTNISSFNGGVEARDDLGLMFDIQ